MDTLHYIVLGLSLISLILIIISMKGDYYEDN